MSFFGNLSTLFGNQTNHQQTRKKIKREKNQNKLTTQKPNNQHSKKVVTKAQNNNFI